jgi:hypothetical protein
MTAPDGLCAAGDDHVGLGARAVLMHSPAFVRERTLRSSDCQLLLGPLVLIGVGWVEARATGSYDLCSADSQSCAASPASQPASLGQMSSDLVGASVCDSVPRLLNECDFIT